MEKKRFCYACGQTLTEKWTEGRNRLFCDNCNRPIYENPIPATSVVVINNREQILLVRRSVEPKIGHWCLPGGFMELGETPEEAALRELLEETGLRGKIDMLLGVTHALNDTYDSILMVGYLIKSTTGSLRPGDDASEARWFNSDHLPDVAFRSHKKFIRMVDSAFSQTTRFAFSTL
jgi:8-oxo-dGTP diphosphatase